MQAVSRLAADVHASDVTDSYLACALIDVGNEQRRVQLRELELQQDVAALQSRVSDMKAIVATFTACVPLRSPSALLCRPLRCLLFSRRSLPGLGVVVFGARPLCSALVATRESSGPAVVRQLRWCGVVCSFLSVQQRRAAA